MMLCSLGLKAQDSSILSLFQATAFEGKVLLNWQIIAGSTCDGVKIMHATDSVNFTQIGEIIGVCGSVTEPVNYSFTHDTPVKNGKNYYRLQLGAAGKSNVIHILLVDVEGGGYQIRPHPVSNAATLYFDKASQGLHTLTFFTMGGLQVQWYKSVGNAFDIYTHGLANGLYLFTIADDEGVVKTKGKLVVAN